MATVTAQDRVMYIERIPKIFRNTYWYSGLTARNGRTFTERDMPIIHNRIELYLSMLGIGKISHSDHLPIYVQTANAGVPRKKGIPVDMWLMESMQKQTPGYGYDHIEYYKIKGPDGNVWITITSAYTHTHTEKLKKDGFVPVKPLYASHASSYIRVQTSTSTRKVSFMSPSEIESKLSKLLKHVPVEEAPAQQQLP